MDAHLPETASQVTAALDRENPCKLSGMKLFQGHRDIMITILIINSRGSRPHRRVSLTVPMRRDAVLELYWTLHAAYGEQGWWPGDDPFEIAVGAILTQRTAWTNAARAIDGLRADGLLSVGALHGALMERVGCAVRPAGCFRSKARKLKAFAAHVVGRHDGDLDRMLDRPIEELRDELLGIYGIGPETADAIALYAAGATTFVVDAYTRRLLERLGWISGGESYDEVVRVMTDELPADADLYNGFHALIVRHGKEHCRSRPVCDGCPLTGLCVYAGEGASRR